MSSIDLYLGLAAFFGSSLIPIIYYRGSGTKLEIRTNSVIKEKKQITRQSYLEVAEKICERFKTQRTLSDKLEEKLEDISYVRFRLDDLPNDLSKVVDKLTFSFVYGFTSVFFIILFAYIPSVDFDPILSLWLQIIAGAFIIVSTYRYLSDGVATIASLRKFEKLVNKIERSSTFERLYELL